jgi:hypothetical protein
MGFNMSTFEQPKTTWTDDEVRETLQTYFSGEHWKGFLTKLESGPHIRHAHAYYNSVFSPHSMAYFLTKYFDKYGLPLDRRIKILPVTEDFLNVYNVQPKGLCHWEFFLDYTPGVLLQPHDTYGARGAHSVEFWDDAFMENYYTNFALKSIGSSERADADAYFESAAFVENLLINIDEFGGVVHSHALIETSLHPEELVKIGAEHIERRGFSLIRATSVVFNNFGLDIGKMTFLLEKPEIVIEVEWHYNPNITIRPGVLPYFRVSRAENLSRILQSRPYTTFSRHLADDVVESLF